MSGTGGKPASPASKPRALAFYLPQFHPIPENDQWWGKGFTEWANVAKARPLYPGHYQPHLPGELGYYDLRVPEIREAQAELARDHGISGFVYYHYWFQGRRLLERPFEEVLASGSPDFPFALCWANEPWTRNWDSQTGQLLMPQSFDERDDLEHIRWLIRAFSDDRYIKIDGKPLFLIYRPALLPDPVRTTDTWRAEAQRFGFPDLYLAWVESWGWPPGGPMAAGLDATVGFMPLAGSRVFAPLDSYRGHQIVDYESACAADLARPAPFWKRFPAMTVTWDNTARRRHRATIFEGATPSAYERWLRRTVDSVSDVRREENLLFILAWNEWAEGNHLEPDRRYGRAFLEATRAVLLDPTPSPRPAQIELRKAAAEEAGDGADGSGRTLEGTADQEADANAVGLVRDLGLDPQRLIVDLGSGSGRIGHALAAEGLAYHGIDLDERAVAAMRSAGLDATQCDLTDFDDLAGVLEERGDVGAVIMLDLLDRLLQPQELLSCLSAWALKNGDPTLVVSVANVAHLDVGLRLLGGSWDPTRTGLRDSTQLRFFTESTLERLFERCGWKVVAREDVHAIHSDHHSPVLHDEVPEELIGALRVLSEAYNPAGAVQQFVWALTPQPVTEAPISYLAAVDDRSDASDVAPAAEAARRVRDYMVSVGLVVSETNRRVARELRNGSRPGPAHSMALWKRAVLRVAYRSPRSAATFRRVHGWLR